MFVELLFLGRREEVRGLVIPLMFSSTRILGFEFLKECFEIFLCTANNFNCIIHSLLFNSRTNYEHNFLVSASIAQTQLLCAFPSILLWSGWRRTWPQWMWMSAHGIQFKPKLIFTVHSGCKSSAKYTNHAMCTTMKMFKIYMSDKNARIYYT